ncbi:hypothetical protein VO70_03635 [Aeromonas salmonicida]|nr:hypothetical protein VO70_03635 [Aeromonas salmonicida]
MISICCKAMTAWVRFLTLGLRKAGVIWALRVARGSVVLDIHLLQGNDRLGTILDAGLAKGGSDMDLDGGKGVSRP